LINDIMKSFCDCDHSTWRTCTIIPFFFFFFFFFFEKLKLYNYICCIIVQVPWYERLENNSTVENRISYCFFFFFLKSKNFTIIYVVCSSINFLYTFNVRQIGFPTVAAAKRSRWSQCQSQIKSNFFKR